MKVSKEELKIIYELFGQYDQFKPIVGKSIEILKDFSGELKPLLEGANVFFTKLTIDKLRMYTEAGFTKEEALQLIIADKIAYREFFNKTKNSK